VFPQVKLPGDKLLHWDFVSQFQWPHPFPQISSGNLYVSKQRLYQLITGMLRWV
jgi:hypothetical protein